jgi:hypothetical protein
MRFYFQSYTTHSLTHFYRFWIRHGAPKFIEISSQEIIRQFAPNGALCPDTCDAMLRRFQQPGSSGNKMDWRHFMETDFPVRPKITNTTFLHTYKHIYPIFNNTHCMMLTKQMRVIAGEDYISSRSVQHQWVGKHIRNDISKCMLVTH